MQMQKWLPELWLGPRRAGPGARCALRVGEVFSRAQHNQVHRALLLSAKLAVSLGPSAHRRVHTREIKAHSQVRCTHNPYAKLGLT